MDMRIAVVAIESEFRFRAISGIFEKRHKNMNVVIRPQKFCDFVILWLSIFMQMFRKVDPGQCCD